MADSVDIASANDFTEEKLALHRNRKEEQVRRGTCLFCNAVIDPQKLYCDDDCKEDFEREQLIKRKTTRMANHPGQY